MDKESIINNLEYITVSRLVAVSKLYNYDCSTSNITRLHKALKVVITECKRVECRVNIDVEHGEVIDMFNAVEKAMVFYKNKHNRSTFPKDINIYKIIEDFRKLDAGDILKQVLAPPVKSKVVTKKTKKEIDYELFLKEEKLKLMKGVL